MINITEQLYKQISSINHSDRWWRHKNDVNHLKIIEIY